MNNYIDNLNWRYATKKFDATKKVSKEDFETILEAASLTASSYGLQPYKILVIEDSAIREKLKPFAWGQSQITDATYLIAFVNQTTFGEELVDSYLENVSITRNIPAEGLAGYADFMKSKLMPLANETKGIWTAKQTYIALGNVLSAAADLKIDTCPMEGFDAVEFNKILGLDEQNLNTSVLVTIGYRAAEDETQHYKKVRKSKENLIQYI
jgi:nitroreductase